jgi:hypothetical protein
VPGGPAFYRCSQFQVLRGEAKRHGDTFVMATL